VENAENTERRRKLRGYEVGKGRAFGRYKLKAQG